MWLENKEFVQKRGMKDICEYRKQRICSKR